MHCVHACVGTYSQVCTCGSQRLKPGVFHYDTVTYIFGIWFVIEAGAHILSRLAVSSHTPLGYKHKLP